MIAKIEKPEALDRLEAIVDEAQAVMVARGDLGVEIDVAEVPIAQKRIIEICNRRLRKAARSAYEEPNTKRTLPCLLALVFGVVNYPCNSILIRVRCGQLLVDKHTLIPIMQQRVAISCCAHNARSSSHNATTHIPRY